MSMNPEDVNRINYNCYYVDQNLNTYVRRRMQAESLMTPLNHTPNSYDDAPAAKMKLLGTHGHLYPVSAEEPNTDYNNRLEPYERRFNDARYGQINSNIMTREEFIRKQNEERNLQNKTNDINSQEHINPPPQPTDKIEPEIPHGEMMNQDIPQYENNQIPNDTNYNNNNNNYYINNYRLSQPQYAPESNYNKYGNDYSYNYHYQNK